MILFSDLSNAEYKKLKRSGIYVIKNLSNSKVYVGSAVDIRRRVQGHIRDLTNNKHHSVHLQRAWNYHGVRSFALEVVEEVEIIELIQKEQFYMDKLRAANKRHGYNIYPMAGSALGVKHRAAVRAAMSRRRKGHRHSEKTKQNMSEAQFERFAGKGHSESTKKKIAARAFGRTVRTETRKKIAKSNAVESILSKASRK